MPKGIAKNPEEKSRKISNAHKGMKKPWAGKYLRTEKHLEQLEYARSFRPKGFIPKSAFKKGISMQLGKHWKIKDTSKMKGFIPWNKGKKYKTGKPSGMLGKKASETTRRKMSKSQKLRVLNGLHHNYKGGITEENHLIRRGIEFRLWRESVFARDNWTCQKYGIKGGKLHPHHIQNFAQFPELRFAIDNGITLSEKAHREFHKLYGEKNNTKGQLQEFLNNNLTK